MPRITVNKDVGLPLNPGLCGIKVGEKWKAKCHYLDEGNNHYLSCKIFVLPDTVNYPGLKEYLDSLKEEMRETFPIPIFRCKECLEATV